MPDHDLIEIAARTAFSHEQCDRRQSRMLADNWNQRLSDEDRAEYRALASAILANVESIIRADEREWIAQAIENECDRGDKASWEKRVYDAAARIARNGGSDA